MDFVALVKRGWELVWNNKWLILLGILAVLGGSGVAMGSNGANYEYQQPNQPQYAWEGDQGDFDPEDFDFDSGDFDPDDFEFFWPEDVPEPDWDAVAAAVAAIAALGIALVFISIALLCVLIIVFIVLWLIGIIASGGMIAGIDVLDSGGESSFALAWQAGWKKFGRLLGIRLVTWIPVLLIFVVIALMVGVIMGSVVTEVPVIMGTGISLSVILGIVLLGTLGLIIFFLGILRMLADRACMLEDLRVFEAYKRAFIIFRDNILAILLVYSVQLGFMIVIATIFGVPIFFFTCCCCLWPVLLAIMGTFTALFSAVWTLAWQKWTVLHGV
ncbi:MAG: hypothetical protein JXJ17_02540 [Anaerolineae bacterium]|nr:hypothetical protein [Anaerolineae bacterium]